jgi:hypothetical protein
MASTTDRTETDSLMCSTLILDLREEIEVLE